MAVWVDLNDDGAFDETEIVGTVEDVGASTSGEDSELVLNIPVTASPGEHRMRVMLQYNEMPEDACNATSSYGMTRDYTTNILSLPDCDGNPDPGTITGDESIGVCAGLDFELTVEGATEAGNMTYEWQMKDPDGEDWETAEGSGVSSFTLIANIDEPTDYRFTVQCGDGDVISSDPVQVT